MGRELSLEQQLSLAQHIAARVEQEAILALALFEAFLPREKAMHLGEQQAGSLPCAENYLLVLEQKAQTAVRPLRLSEP
jgi:hypothetical protein